MSASTATTSDPTLPRAELYSAWARLIDTILPADTDQPDMMDLPTPPSR